jgi:hypothetical protein
MTGHTEGHWKVYHYEDSIEVWPVKPGGSVIAILTARPEYPGEQEIANANAQLIASAPDMQARIDALGEALRECLCLCTGFAKVILKDKYVEGEAERKARAALKSAGLEE